MPGHQEAKGQDARGRGVRDQKARRARRQEGQEARVTKH